MMILVTFLIVHCVLLFLVPAPLCTRARRNPRITSAMRFGAHTTTTQRRQQEADSWRAVDGEQEDAAAGAQAKISVAKEQLADARRREEDLQRSDPPPPHPRSGACSGARSGVRSGVRFGAEMSEVCSCSALMSSCGSAGLGRLRSVVLHAGLSGMRGVREQAAARGVR
eukprot:2375712-Rhodomonas_salina.2